MKFYEKAANDVVYVTTHSAVMAAQNAINNGIAEGKLCEKKILYADLIEFAANLIGFENERGFC